MNKKVDVILGLQWGDEGKGKIVDKLSRSYDIIARFQGGPNAGHTLQIKSSKYILHTIPSGIFNKKINIIGNGVVVDPVILYIELQKLNKINKTLINDLIISKKTHLILPTHKLLDKASEQYKGNKKIGSTLKGIAPTYMDKTGRNGLRFGDILTDEFKLKYKTLTNKHKQIIKIFNFKINETELLKMEKEWFNSIKYLKKIKLMNCEIFLNECINKNKNILAEGAQGTLLDIDFGSYPYVTSSNTISAGACIGLGVAPNTINKIYGIFKAYCTRVGSGPFPTEVFGDMNTNLVREGCEFGSTTGRERRCGWLDLPLLKYAINLNGVTDLSIMKVDVLSFLDEIKVCIGYKNKNKISQKIPYKLDKNTTPVYKIFKGWRTEIKKLKTIKDAPKELITYLKFIENFTNRKIKIISYGPERNQTLIL